jgi:protein-S-isoprenylcysteine O-methyltransferase Ste14
MALIFVSLRTVVFAGGFLGLWTWAALMLRRFDLALGGPLPAWPMRWAPFDAPRRLGAAGPCRHARNPMYIGGPCSFWGLGLDQRSPSIVLFFVPAWGRYFTCR